MDRVKVLVVDDESRMRKLVRDFLIRDNFDVLEAADGEEALDIFYRDKEISLIILDIMMPKINGWDVCREIRETSKIPIIMLTAKGEETDELQGSGGRRIYRKAVQSQNLSGARTGDSAPVQ